VAQGIVPEFKPSTGKKKKKKEKESITEHEKYLFLWMSHRKCIWCLTHRKLCQIPDSYLAEPHFPVESITWTSGSLPFN
jgi:thioredoxin-related protein